MRNPAWLLIVSGLLIAAVGVLWLLPPAAAWLGRLPGDIAIERGNVRFYFPLMTCLVLSALLSAIVWLAQLLSR
jgi:hypothetical protein